ncbi:hypothetical protein JW930_05635 [Candidatus Woesearchaeota archaeon]|nr:hypothetical protein [Candidatus Woesearchaeota archaeon]
MIQKEKVFLKPEAILRYLCGNEKLHTLIACKDTTYDLITTDQSLYEALGSVKNRSEIDINLLVKLLEVTEIIPHRQTNKEEREILTPQRVQEIRDNKEE